MQTGKRRIALFTVLSVLTGGLFGLYWQYGLIRQTQKLKTERTRPWDELIAMVFIPFYHVWWWYTRAKTLEAGCEENGRKPAGKVPMYVLFSLFFLDVVNAAMMQSNFDRLGDDFCEPVEACRFESGRVLLLFRCLSCFPLIPLYWLYGGMVLLYGGDRDNSRSTPISAGAFLNILVVLSAIGILLIILSLVNESILKNREKSSAKEATKE